MKVCRFAIFELEHQRYLRYQNTPDYLQIFGLKKKLAFLPTSAYSVMNKYPERAHCFHARVCAAEAETIRHRQIPPLYGFTSLFLSMSSVHPKKFNTASSGTATKRSITQRLCHLT
jgi:hypothetical protein